MWSGVYNRIYTQCIPWPYFPFMCLPDFKCLLLISHNHETSQLSGGYCPLLDVYFLSLTHFSFNLFFIVKAIHFGSLFHSLSSIISILFLLTILFDFALSINPSFSPPHSSFPSINQSGFSFFIHFSLSPCPFSVRYLNFHFALHHYSLLLPPI